jgi:hypothetical protein
MDLHRDPLPFRYRKEIGFSYIILNALLETAIKGERPTTARSGRQTHRALERLLVAWGRVMSGQDEPREHRADDDAN